MMFGDINETQRNKDFTGNGRSSEFWTNQKLKPQISQSVLRHL